MTIAPMSADAPLASIVIAPTNMPSVGDTAVITWNGTEYTCTGVIYTEDGETNMGVMFGNAGAMLPGAAVTNEPFLFVVLAPEFVADMGAYAMCIILDGSASVTFAANVGKQTIHKIDEKFLPPQTHGINETEIVYLPETECIFLMNGMYGSYVSIKQMKAGDKCVVTYNGVDYNCTVQIGDDDAQYDIVLGNGELLGGEDANYPFGIGVLRRDTEWAQTGLCFVVQTYDKAEKAVVSIMKPIGFVEKIDSKYLPDASVNVLFMSKSYLAAIEGKVYDGDETYVANMLFAEAVDALKNKKIGQFVLCTGSTIVDEAGITVVKANMINASTVEIYGDNASLSLERPARVRRISCKFVPVEGDYSQILITWELDGIINVTNRPQST